MKRIFCTAQFSRWLSSSAIDEADLLCAVEEMEFGLVDANLGGNLYKKRIAIPGQGKRSGARVVLATRYEERWFFLYGFNKNERSNISKKELKALQELGQDLLNLSKTRLSLALQSKKIKEVLP